MKRTLKESEGQPTLDIFKNLSWFDDLTAARSGKKVARPDKEMLYELYETVLNNFEIGRYGIPVPEGKITWA